MRRALATAAPLLLALLLGGGVASGEGVTLYVARVLTVPAGSVTIGSIVRVVGQIPPTARELLLRTAAVVSDKVLYIPASLYLGDIESAFGNTAIIVGTRTVLVPEGTSAQTQSYLLDRLADFLESQELVGDSVTEIAFSQGIARGSAPRDGTPVFRTSSSARGITEVSFTLTDSTGSIVAGRTSFATSLSDSSPSVRAGSPVQIVFRKGPIMIEMPGKALGSAVRGQQVSVAISENQKMFVGKVTDEREVQVDLP